MIYKYLFFYSFYLIKYISMSINLISDLQDLNIQLDTNVLSAKLQFLNILKDQNNLNFLSTQIKIRNQISALIDLTDELKKIITLDLIEQLLPLNTSFNNNDLYFINNYLLNNGYNLIELYKSTSRRKFAIPKTVFRIGKDSIDYEEDSREIKQFNNIYQVNKYNRLNLK